MTKKRKMLTPLRVAYGIAGRIQEEMETFQGFQEVADREGWQVVILYEQFETQLRNLLGHQAVDAVVGDFMSAHWVESLPEDLALVHRGRNELGPNLFSVTPDHGEGIAQAVMHFMEMGYGEVVGFSPRRMEGLAWIRSVEELRDLYMRSENIGIFCASDFLARQAIQLARSLNRKVPEQFGFVGEGDRRLDRLLADMEISSLPMPHREMGRTSAELLSERLKGATPRQVRLRPGRLLTRQSSRKSAFKAGLKSRVDEWILNQLADPLPVEEWAKRVGMSRRSFENAFSAEVGFTPYAYLMNLRVEEAKRLLRETDWTIARIGQAVGIPDPPRFSAFFKRNTGHTASAWRSGN